MLTEGVANTAQERERLFQAVLGDHQGALARLCRGYERDRAKQEELLQEILLQAWRSLEHFRGDSSLRTWVLRIAHNVAASHVRSAMAVKRSSDMDAPTNAPPDPHAHLEGQERIAALHHALHALPSLDRQLILLYLEDIPNTEIVEITGLSASNVSTRIHRAKSKLESALKGESR